jgi:hypothetical protein
MESLVLGMRLECSHNGFLVSTADQVFCPYIGTWQTLGRSIHWHRSAIFSRATDGYMRKDVVGGQVSP